MVRRVDRFTCSVCDNTFMVWEGVCRSCGNAGTIAEVIPDGRVVKRETESARKIRRRAKDSERGIARRMIDADGEDPAWKSIASSTGRIGHVTGIRVDAVSKNYFTENKNRKLPTWLVAAWLLINQRARDFDKHALLHIEPPNMARDYVLNTVKYKLDNMAIITQPRHEELILAERALYELMVQLENVQEWNVEIALKDAHATLNTQIKTKK